MTNTTSEYVTDTSGNIVMEGDGVTPKLKVTSSSINAYAKGDGLIVQGRTNAWNGAKLPLDPAIFKPNRTYSFTVYVWSPVDDDFKLTFNDGLGGNEPLQVLNSGERSVHVQAETWTPITGTIQLTKQIDPYNMYLLIETLPVNGNYQTSILPNGGDYFRIDEFIAVEGNTPVTVDQGSGKVYVGEVQSQTQTGTAYNFQFSNGMEGWHVQDFDDGNSGTQVKSEGNNFPGIQVYGRDQHNDGIAINVPKLIPGNTYQFSGRVQEDGPNPNNGSPVAQVLQLTLNTGTGQYPAILKDFNMNTDSSNNYQYRDFSVSFQIPADADPSTMSIYFETPEPRNGANPDLGSFRVHYLTITGEYATGSGTSVELDDVPGYDETTGQYVSDYSNYNMILDVDSVTKPLRLLDTEYKTDYVSENVEWERVVTLPDEGDPADPWKYHWDNQNPADTDHYLDEVHTDTEKYLYIYHLEETWIDSEGNVINTIVKEGEADKFISNDENYLVTYTDNDVATNTPGSPILVTNRYIWYKLPATGGAGADVFYGTGLLLTLTGFIGGYALRKRERRFK